MWSPGTEVTAQALARTPGLQQQALRVMRSSVATDRENFVRDVYRHVVKMSKHSSDEWARQTAFLASGLLLHGAVKLATSPHMGTGGRVQARRQARRRFDDDWEEGIVEAYNVLGLQPGATKKEIEKAFKNLSLSNHPDKGGTAAKQAEILAAKETLLPKFVPPQPDVYEPMPEPTGFAWQWEKTKREWAYKLGMNEHFFVRDAIAALVLAGVVSAAVYYLIWRPCRRKYNEKRQRAIAQQAAQQVQVGMKRAAAMADGLPNGRMRKVAALGLQEARHTVTALHQGRPSVISQGLSRVVTWSRRALASVVHTVKRVATNAVALVTRFARRWSPSRWWPKTQAVRSKVS